MAKPLPLTHYLNDILQTCITTVSVYLLYPGLLDGLFFGICLNHGVLTINVKHVFCHDNLPQTDS